MEYKLSNNYLSNNVFNRAVSGLTGLALLVNTTGCIDAIQGVRLQEIRRLIKSEDQKPGSDNYNINKPIGTPSAPETNTLTALPVTNEETQNNETDFYKNPKNWKFWAFYGGIAAVGVGTYFLVDELNKGSKKDDDMPTVFGSNGPGGGPGTGGPGGK